MRFRGVCDFACDSDQQCAAAGNSYRCVGGRCRESVESSQESPNSQGGATAKDVTDSTDDVKEPTDDDADLRLSQIPECAQGRIGHPGGVFQIFAGQNVTLSPYCLDAYEVTVKDYQACVADGGCMPASTQAGSSSVSGEESWPVTGVNAVAASAYCKWAEGRLPQSTELTWAGRGEERDFEYPWGDVAPEVGDVPKKLCWNSSSLCDIGSFEVDQTARGVFDLAGNAQELSVLEVSDTAPRYCRFGGAYDIGEGALKELFWVGSCVAIPVNHSFGSLGFRCAADAIE